MDKYTDQCYEFYAVRRGMPRYTAICRGKGTVRYRNLNFAVYRGIPRYNAARRATV